MKNTPYCLWTSAGVVTVANTTTPTTLLDTGVGSKTIPANYLKAGALLRFEAQGSYLTKAAPVGTFTFTPGMGVGVVLSPAWLSPSSVAYWKLTALLSVLSLGASGTCAFQAMVNWLDGGVSTLNSEALEYDTTLNTTSNVSLSFLATWATADANNSVICRNASFELLNN